MTRHFGFGRKPERVAILEFDQLSRERADPGGELGARQALLRGEGAQIARDRRIGRLRHDGPPGDWTLVAVRCDRAMPSLPPALAESAAATAALGG
ncbi:MAG TPA: hypothetical protein VKM54_29900, partial [Myxococcota bacterium]|nr:hypothetical protein [Myxococcota bacterium]